MKATIEFDAKRFETDAQYREEVLRLQDEMIKAHTTASKPVGMTAYETIKFGLRGLGAKINDVASNTKNNLVSRGLEAAVEDKDRIAKDIEEAERNAIEAHERIAELKRLQKN